MIKQNILKLLPVVIILALFLSGCTEKIDLKLGGTYTRLVVDGCITTDTIAHSVKLTTTSDFFNNEPSPTVSGALVSITDGTRVFPLTEDPLNPGVYKTDPTVFGQPGKTYTLSIQLANEINGYSAYEAYCYLNPVSKMDSISVVYMDSWELWEIQCWAYDPPQTNFYMFNIFKNNILMTDTINKVMVTDDRLFNGSYTNGAGIGYLRKDFSREKVFPGDTIKAQIAGITQDYMKFITQVQIESGYKNPLISGPPANIMGNINNGAIGFFSAYSVKYCTTIVK
ncbi:MAG: DUF4249 domain-containing protein [Bacteroidetes bacterium]|nr:DUF4249 domain-containing protein [Bacteroidota bacterium]